MDRTLPILAGLLSTTIFALSTLAMVVKAYQTKDLRSYSLGNLVLANVGNLVHTLYIVHLPPGPIWLLHGYHLVTTGLMLIWCVRYRHRRAGTTHWGHRWWPHRDGQRGGGERRRMGATPSV